MFVNLLSLLEEAFPSPVTLNEDPVFSTLVKQLAEYATSRAFWLSLESKLAMFVFMSIGD